MNVVALQGRLVRAAEAKVLPSGDRLANLEVSVEGPEGRRESVPVAWFGAPEEVSGYEVGSVVVVVGRVRRRFFRASGGTASRTEVVADVVVPVARVGPAVAALQGAAARLVLEEGEAAVGP
ncbi:MAG: single-stranded DNA-binding protein [Acidimicrobiales bacterium]